MGLRKRKLCPVSAGSPPKETPVRDINWFALRVKPHHERVVAENLRQNGLEVFLPLCRGRRRWSDRIQEVRLCLFPGYVFCRFTYADRLLVLGLPGVYSMVGFGGKPVPVEDWEIQSISALVESPLPLGPWPYLRVGERARILNGPLEGLEGILIREKGIWRVVVSVDVLQRSVAVEIDREMVCRSAAPWKGTPAFAASPAR